MTTFEERSVKYPALYVPTAKEVAIRIATMIATCRAIISDGKVMPADLPHHGPVNWSVRCEARHKRLIPADGLLLDRVVSLIQWVQDGINAGTGRKMEGELLDAIVNAAVRIQNRQWACAHTRFSSQVFPPAGVCGVINWCPIIPMGQESVEASCMRCQKHTTICRSDLPTMMTGVHVNWARENG